MNQPLPKTDPKPAYEIETLVGVYQKPIELRMDGCFVGRFTDYDDAFDAMVLVRQRQAALDAE